MKRSTQRFRDDINGLRAIAVVAVILFHFQVPGFEGGYLGVDLFFVISGFLMMAILVRGLEGGQGARSLLQGFYAARARRIVPALLVLVFALLVLGLAVLPTTHYQELAAHSLFALVFLSNLKFWQETGYFDLASQEKWLLHTWSLSVEWQFYLLLPLLLLAVWRLWPRRDSLFYGVLGLGALSFALSVVVTPSSPSSAFFLLHTRAWEFFVGSAVFLAGDKWGPGPKAREILGTGGIGLILMALVLFDSDTPWPGAAALLPVAGTALVLFGAVKDPAWARWRGTQWVGLRSYSLYLWHWPVVVALAFTEMSGSLLAVGLGILLAMILAELSYRFVEQPARRSWLVDGRRAAPAVMVGAAFAIGLSAFYVHQNQGVAGRMPSQVERIAAEAFNVNPHRDRCHSRGGDHFPWCNSGGDEIREVVVGDSHASAVVSAVEAALRSESEGVIAASYTSCQTLFDVRKTRPGLRCAEFNEFLLEQIRSVSSDVPVFVVNRTSAAVFGTQNQAGSGNGVPSVYFGDTPHPKASAEFLAEFRDRMIESTCRLAVGRKVYLLRPFPEMPADVPRTMARRALAGLNEPIQISREEYDARHAFVWDVQDAAAETCNVEVLDPTPYLCDEAVCFGSHDGLPIYYDDHHLSERGNRLLVPMFEQALYRLQEAAR